jgi:hypothetical protein
MDVDALDDLLGLNELSWHDGRLRSLEYLTSESTTEVLLSMEIYEDEHSRERHAVTFRFSGVRDYTHAGSSAELQAHYNAGHIMQARLNVGRNETNQVDHVDLSVYLTGGYIRIVAESVLVVGEART